MNYLSYFYETPVLAKTWKKTYMTPSFPLKYGSSIITQFSILY